MSKTSSREVIAVNISTTVIYLAVSCTLIALNSYPTSDMFEPLTYSIIFCV